MRIPRRLEWRAGVALVGGALILVSLMVGLTLARTDVGLALEGFLTRTERGWVLSVTASEDRLALLRRCEQVRLTDRRDREQYATISGMGGRWLPETGEVRAEITFTEPVFPWSAITDSSGWAVQAMFIEERAAPIFGVLVASALRTPKG